MTTNKQPNRLAKEKSPYLLQHQYNPVDWFPWGDDAFAKAQAEDKPIFLSIGYSTCHWCHVMERESFEDTEVAELLNRDFVCIKVDREERPDIDHLYMAICQAMTGQGGWPLTIVMTPAKKPFFAGTYFPKKRKFGRYGLVELLPQIAEKWRSERERVTEIGEKIVEETQKRMISQFAGELSENILDEAFESYVHMFDSIYGGFGRAPKFPTPHNLSFLLRYYDRTAEPKALAMVEKTLEAMYRGGIYDHIGFGFARYSTDEHWLVPHFEKMLYDNALLSIAYLEAFQVTGNRRYKETAEQIFTYVLRDMADPEGGFYSAEDADSEGVEGKFYVWTPEEVLQVLGEEDGELFCELYDITEEGNFEGHNIPNLMQYTPDQFTKLKQISTEVLLQKMETCKQKLFAHREHRIHPHKDDKILTSWNGLMIAALAKGAVALQNEKYTVAAEKAARFIREKLFDPNGRLLARYRDGEAAYLGYVDDYACLIWGLIELYEATFNVAYLQDALRLQKEMDRLFWDQEQGGYFFYGNDSEQLFTRMKEIYDGAMPSGNSITANNLVRLAHLSGNPQLMDRTEQQLNAFARAVNQYPAGHAMFMTAIAFAYGSPQEIVIAGKPEDAVAQRMIAIARQNFSPNSVLLFHPEGDTAMEELLPAVSGKRAVQGNTAAYVCENFACQTPVTNAEALERTLLSK